MENKLPVLIKRELMHWGFIPTQGRLFRMRRTPDAVIVPGKLPLFINPKAKIRRDGTVENLSDFKTVDDVFDFRRCLQCTALQKECYGSSGESPCMKCIGMERELREKNSLTQHISSTFHQSSMVH